MLNKERSTVLLLITAALAVYGCSSASSRSQQHEGVNITLKSVARMSVYQAGMQSVRPKDPEHEIAVVQLEFSPAGTSNIKLSADQVQLTDADNKTHNSEVDLEFSLGGADRVMVWDITFAVPKSAVLKSLRVGSANFELGGVRDLDPTARVTPGSQPAMN